MIYLPKIFSQNNDGVNDCLPSSGHERTNLISYHQLIFERWKTMFESFDISDCWDGLYKGNPVRPGIYVYITDILTNQSNEAKNLRHEGDVIFIR